MTIICFRIFQIARKAAKKSGRRPEVKTGVLSGDSVVPPKIKVHREKSRARIFKLLGA